MGIITIQEDDFPPLICALLSQIAFIDQAFFVSWSASNSFTLLNLGHYLLGGASCPKSKGTGGGLTSITVYCRLAELLSFSTFNIDDIVDLEKSRQEVAQQKSLQGSINTDSARSYFNPDCSRIGRPGDDIKRTQWYGDIGKRCRVKETTKDPPSS